MRSPRPHQQKKLSPPARAYLDAGTGAMIIQMLAAAVLGAGFVLKGYWRRIKDFFTSKPDEDSDSDA